MKITKQVIADHSTFEYAIHYEFHTKNGINVIAKLEPRRGNLSVATMINGVVDEDTVIEWADPTELLDALILATASEGSGVLETQLLHIGGLPKASEG